MFVEDPTDPEEFAELTRANEAGLPIGIEWPADLTFAQVQAAALELLGIYTAAGWEGLPAALFRQVKARVMAAMPPASRAFEAGLEAASRERLAAWAALPPEEQRARMLADLASAPTYNPTPPFRYATSWVPIDRKGKP